VFRQNCEDTFQIPKHIIVPKPQHTEVILGEPEVAHGILLGIGMLSTVDLNDQPRCETEKIGDIGTK
jgi:hypothetical protein